MAKKGQFKLDLSKALKEVTEDANRIARGTSFAVMSNVIKRTPVGNPSTWKVKKSPKGYVGGSLRGAWNAKVGSPDLTVRNSKDKSGSKTIGEAGTVIFSWNPIGGASFFLANPLPYAERVEYNGWSGQAPKGMLRISVVEARRHINKL